MRITQGTFSFLPDLTEKQIENQVKYAISKKWSIGIEYTEDPHPRNSYWELWGLPLFDLKDPSTVISELKTCIKQKSNFYIKLSAFDNTRGTESCVLSFIVNRPSYEPGFELVRTEDVGRNQRYSFRSYATAKPEGSRY
uniref:Multifunctional fusion protein n=1 Tax=Plocamium cartilagineum TaxID=31452 RepID=A0A1C9CHN0_PLOCA|nr:ribulose-1,5-bisphosphate carboxylase/oxygenase small subunit [Plocamium cartilagineum]AOM67900.1 ribulose-1,5-bisphosphate carboxylase/oxygenase small subunit [Plocamium cartilagineum]